MKTRLPIIVLIVILANACVLISSRHLSSSTGPAQAAGIALLETSGCLQPCWHNIRLGKTTLEQAARILAEDGTLRVTTQDLYELCWITKRAPVWSGCASHWSSSDPTSPIERLLLWPAPDALHLGDVILTLGKPQSIVLCWRTYILAIHIYLNDRIAVMAYLTDGSWPQQISRLDPRTAVQEVLYNLIEWIPHSQARQPWKGFTLPQGTISCTE
jgi:hypothetical protein